MRPAKRRKTDTLPSEAEDDSVNEFIDDEPSDDLASTSSDGEELKLPRPPSSQDLYSDESPAPRQNPRIHIPTRAVDDETTFVTQLTQPPSSPSRIRGPRWKKRRTPSERSATGSDYDEPAAKTPAEAIPSRSHSIKEKSPVDLSAVLQDNPDFFEDDFDLDEDELMLIDAVESTSRAEAVKPQITQNLRQTTLSGRPPPNSSFVTHTQRRTHNWPLSNKQEAATHHELDVEALRTWVYPTNLGSIRDYQYNITQRGLFHNTLVALPTGLGKTFIAATIMLNWYRWTKDSQVIFVAPTKPLVAQQVDACFNIVGIPRSDTSMLTGNIQPALRAQEYLKKRVFFMTPQTVLHDLKSGICDPKKIVLLVVDEAHRATGNYAYVEVVRFLRRFNTSFRVLALTATPGSTVEGVQNVIDGLDISRVEIRTEESLDIRQYVHRRNIETEIFEYSEEVTMIMDLFSKALQPIVNKLTSQNAYWSRDPMSLTAFGLTKARQQWFASDAGKRAHQGIKGMMHSIFSLLASLAHSLDLLKFHGIGPFYRGVKDFYETTLQNAKGGKYAKEVCNNEHFKKMMARIKTWINNEDFIGHPKLSFLKTIVLNHFLDAGAGVGAADGRPPSETRVMIFVQFRDSAEEVTRVLKKHYPMIRPHVFVGQAGAKGSDGMDQKTQLDIISKFKSGEYNTIVATSIGEEGLDIGEVDLIVCYDSSSSPIRMLQRMGRTGRKRAGNIYLLLMKGKEEDSYVKAKDNYEKMQAMIANGSRFTFHDDRSPRIVPKDIQPVVDKRVIEIPPENTQNELPEPKKRGRIPKKPPKKFHMPDGVQDGFVKASRLQGGTNEYMEDRDSPVRATKLPENVEPVPLPPLSEVLLSTAEERGLESQYCSVSGDSPQFVRVPDLGAFPAYQNTQQRTQKVPHGRSSKRLTKALQTKSPFRKSLPPKNRPSMPTAGTEALDLPTTSLQPPRSGEEIEVVDISTQKSLIELEDILSTGKEDKVGQNTNPAKFYVSQKVTESSDDEALPSPTKLLSVKGLQDKENRRSGKKEKSILSKPSRQRKRRIILHDEDDDDS